MGAGYGAVTSSDDEGTADADAPVTLQGRGVGPVGQVPLSVSDMADLNDAVQLIVEIDNLTTDMAAYGATADEVALSVLGATDVVNADAAMFNVIALPGPVGEGDTGQITVEFLGSPVPGLFGTTLHVCTDEGAALGSPGAAFDVALSVEVVPEPASVVLLALAAGTLLRRRRPR